MLIRIYIDKKQAHMQKLNSDFNDNQNDFNDATYSTISGSLNFPIKSHFYISIQNRETLKSRFELNLISDTF